MAQLVRSFSTRYTGRRLEYDSARGDAEDTAGGFVHVNPIRTVEHEAAIFRIPKSAVPHPPGLGKFDRVKLTQPLRLIPTSAPLRRRR